MESSSRVAEIVNNLKLPESEDTYTSKSGVKFKLVPMSKMLIVDATKRLDKPKPPVIHIEEKDRTEENPNDPQYMEDVQIYNANRANLIMAIVFAYGCEVIEIPEGFSSVTDTDWSDDLAEFGVPIPIKGRARKAAWIRYHLVPDDNELTQLMQLIMKVGGTTLESDVKDSMDSFRSN